MTINSVPSSHSMQHTFAAAPNVLLPRSKFDMSFGHKTTFDEGLLIPVVTLEVLPGDTFNLSMTALARMATPIYPLMDNMYLESFFFFVPNRLVWQHWEQFNGQQNATPSDTTDYILPTVTAPAMGGVATGDLADYFGLPIKINSLVFQSLPLRAFNLIYNEWFRDENLQDSLTVQLDDGPDTYANYTVPRRGKRHDYFTSCLPWTQKINDGTTVEIPLGLSAPIVSNSTPPTWSGIGGAFTNQNVQANATTNLLQVATGALGATESIYFGSQTGLYANLAGATAASINQLRQAFQLQVLFERDARGGTRYTEIIRSHFGVISPDSRLQRPEYLGGGSQPISVNAVAQTAPSDVGGSGEQLSPQGNLAAFGVAVAHGHGFTKSFTEHGHIIGIVNVRADLNYQQGMNRMWSRSTRYDFYWPSLAHIGEQAVLNQEIYAQGTSADTQVFGYQERYAEYRYMPGLISSLFRSTATNPLDAWHLAQHFTSPPSLGSTFIVENAPMSRVEALSNQQDFICDMFFKIQAARVMPMFGVPMSLDRF